MKIVTIVGARPQFVKAAVVSRAIGNYNAGVRECESAGTVASSLTPISEIIIHTGQHFDANMSDVFFDEMSIPRPDYNLDINGLGHGAMTGQMLEKIEDVLLNEEPDWVLVYGDTNSTIAGALAAKKLHIKVAHVEAGLRSFNMRMPEEINRILTDRISDILFCPTDTAVSNLKREGISIPQSLGDRKEVPASLTPKISSLVSNIGDVMLDAALFYADHARKPECVPEQGFVLATVHRAENTDDPERLRNIFDALLAISKETPVVLPLHPRTKGKLVALGGVYEQLLTTSNYQLIVIPPVSYFEMIWLLQNSSMAMTDSGGLQKEAYFFKRPCITLRDETEWVELVEHGYNKLAGADLGVIGESYKLFKDHELDFSTELYGSGSAGSAIVEALVKT